jgi:2-dehydropantoate 2-reductase
LGFGAVGVGIGWHLSRSNLAFCARDRSGWTGAKIVVQADGRSTVVQPSPYAGTVDLLFVACRAPDLAAALAEIGSIVSPGGVVISLSNGAVESLVKEAAIRNPSLKFRIGCVTFGVTRQSDGSVRYVGGSEVVHWGPVDPTGVDCASSVEQFLHVHVSQFRFAPDAIWLCRRKWLINTVINTLCAAHDLYPNHRVRQVAGEMDSIFDESFRLGESLWGPWPFRKQELRAYLEQVVTDTADNTNSMVRDLQLGRQTESSYMAGLAQDPKLYPKLVQLHAAVLQKSHH